MTRSRRRAFTLLEATFSIVLVGGLVVVALDTVGASTVAKQALSDAAAGRLLGASVMAEVLRRDYEDPDGAPLFGLEMAEMLVERDSYDDIDDYNGLAVSPPQYADGTVIPGYEGWSYSVDVVLVDQTDLSKEELADEGVKRIQVRVFRDGVEVVSFWAIKTGIPGDKLLPEVF